MQLKFSKEVIIVIIGGKRCFRFAPGGTALGMGAGEVMSSDTSETITTALQNGVKAAN